MRKSSRGCAVCRKRKIKCDQATPRCTPCVKANWECGGYREADELVFRHETDLVVDKATARAKGQSALVIAPSRPKCSKSPSKSPSHALSWPIEDQALSFFMVHYVTGGESAGYRGFQEYLPNLCTNGSNIEALQAIITAAGLASISNKRRCQEVGKKARIMYLRALRLVGVALGDPQQRKVDETLATVMLLGLFEAVSCDGKQSSSMQNFRHHMRGLAQLINIRGPEQFKTKAGRGLFLHIRRLVLLAYNQMCEPLPCSMRTWSSWARSSQADAELPADDISELISDLIDLRVWMADNPDLETSCKRALLLSIDQQFCDWSRNLSQSWNYRTVAVTSRHNVQECVGQDDFGAYQDVYSDFYVASIWISYYSARILIHKTLMLLVAHDLGLNNLEKQATIRTSLSILQRMTRGVSQSSAFLMGDLPPPSYSMSTASSSANTDNEAIKGHGGPAAGGYMLIWPLYMVGMLETTTRTQRCWIANTLRKYGVMSGANIAVVRADALELAAGEDLRSGRESWPYIDDAEREENIERCKK